MCRCLIMHYFSLCDCVAANQWYKLQREGKLSTNVLFPYVTLAHLKIYTQSMAIACREVVTDEFSKPSVSIIPADLRQLLLCSGRLHSTGPWALQAPSHQCMHVWCFDTLAAECAHASPCQCALPCSSVQRNPWWHQLLDADPLPFDINTTIYQQLALCSYSTGYNTTSRRFLGFCSAVPFRIIATNSL